MQDDIAPLAEALGGRYRIEREIGRGGTATVYLAHDLKHDRQVAIKVLHRGLGASLGAGRFLREIGIAARLTHPHIVPLLDSGEAAGRLYYVSPYVPGGSLRDRLEREGRLPLEEVLRLTHEIGLGLDFAHRSDLVHRDVKPENILFADGQAVLADFGIARACSACVDEGDTDAGIAVGTPEYMSPEQAAGDREITTRSDIYSLACVVFEMLTGRPPLRGDNSQATMAQHVTASPPPLRALRPDAPPAMEAALARALAKSHLERFETVAEFTTALRAATVVPSARFSAATRSVAVLPFVNVSADPGNEYLSDGITDELIDALARVEGLRIASRTSVFALKGQPLDVRAIGALLGVGEVLEGTVRRAADRLRITVQLSSTEDGRLLWSERYDRRLDDVFAIQDEIARTIVDTLRHTSFADLTAPVPRRYTENVTAYGLYLKGRFAWNRRSQEGVAEGIRYFEQAIAEDPGYALAYTGLADCYALHVDYRSVPVHEGFERAKQYARRALELDDSLAEAHASLAWSLFIYDWDWTAAEASFRRAIALNPRYATAHQWFAFLLASQARFEPALVEGHTALELDPASVSVRRGLAWLYYYARRYEEAVYHFTRAAAMNPTAEETYRVLGLTFSLLGQHAEAERVLREALALPHPSSYTRAALGYVLAQAGGREQAESILADLVQEARTGYVSPVAFATLHIGLGQPAAALDCAERALADRRGWLAYLRVHPIVDPLRGEPRFQALLRTMRLDGDVAPGAP